ncbi:hypothetical protein HY991_02535 [Candidatus Micrarchaeota archaeon]|nr:hypothetical protein [Candidatus Micrarchaeota archaeon]
MRITLKLLSFLLAFTLFISATELRISASTVDLSCGEGKVFVWASGNKPVALSASSSSLNGYFENSYSPEGNLGTYFHFSAPDCFKGEENIRVKADFCDPSGCETRYVQLKVFVSPCKACDSYIEGLPRRPALTLGEDSNVISSNILSYASFDPTVYAVELTGPSKCMKVYPREHLRLKYQITNRGAAGTFELSLLGDKQELKAEVSPDYVSLQRNEAKDIFVDVRPSPLGRGKLSLTIQVVHNFVGVEEKDVCINVVDYYSAKVILPTLTPARDCETSLVVKGKIRNEGTTEDDYRLSGSPFAEFPEVVSVGSGEEAGFEIILPDLSKLKLGPNALYVRAESPHVFGEGSTTVILSKCLQPEVSTIQEQNNSVVRIVVQVKNLQDIPLEYVTANITGIPSQWEITKEDSITVPPHSEKNLTILVKQTTNEEAKPVVTVKSGEKTLKTIELPKISAKDGGLTGFLIMALSQNLTNIIIIILTAIIVLLLIAKRDSSERMQHLKKIKEAVS